MAGPYAAPDDATRADAFFATRRAAQGLWNALVAEAQTWGPVQVVATKSRVALLGRTRFLWCPQALVDGRIVVRFLFPHPIDSPRLRVDHAEPRTSHRVHLEALDDEALGWFRAAYEADTA